MPIANSQLPSQRYPELDLARLLAMLMMAVYHTAFDLSFFYGWSIDLEKPTWVSLQKSTLILFLLVNGVSATIAWQRSHNLTKFFRRGLTLLFWSMIITLTTIIMSPEDYIRFGILHCIAIATLLLPFLLPLKLWNAPLGVTIILLGSRVTGRTVSTSLLLPIGFLPPIFHTLDYVPLIPWFGVILLGSAFGHVLYVRGLRPRELALAPWIHTLSTPGKYSLVFYLVHQPVILAILVVMVGLPR